LHGILYKKALEDTAIVVIFALDTLQEGTSGYCNKKLYLHGILYNKALEDTAIVVI
jgi:hypothetical protein